MALVGHCRPLSGISDDFGNTVGSFTMPSRLRSAAVGGPKLGPKTGLPVNCRHCCLWAGAFQVIGRAARLKDYGRLHSTPWSPKPKNWRSNALLIPHNCPLPGRHHALIAHGLVVADRLPFSNHATSPAVGRWPRSTHHAIVLGDRHGRSVLTEGGQPMASERPAKALSEEG